MSFHFCVYFFSFPKFRINSVYKSWCFKNWWELLIISGLESNVIDDFNETFISLWCHWNNLLWMAYFKRCIWSSFRKPIKCWEWFPTFTPTFQLSCWAIKKKKWSTTNSNNLSSKHGKSYIVFECTELRWILLSEKSSQFTNLLAPVLIRV